MMKTMLQLATLVALRTRERGQKEAEARVKISQVRDKERKELAERQLRMDKARDPRNRELQKMIERSGVALTKQRSEQAREFSTLTREQEAPSRVQVLEREQAGPGYDSAESRALFAMELAEVGLDPELIELRMLAEAGQAKPPIEAVRTPIGEAARILDKEQDPRTRIRDLRRER